jgi:hypothetical protein
MKNRFLHGIFVLLVTSMLMSGCDRKPVITRGEATQIISAGGSITDSTRSIDSIVEGSVYQEPVKVETENIRSQVKLLSYEEIEALYRPKFQQLERTIKERDKKISNLEKLVGKLRANIEKLENYAREKQVAILTWLGVALIPITIALLYFRMREFAGLAAVTSVASFGAAQLIGSPYFLIVIIAATLIIAAFAGYGMYKQSISNEVEDFTMSTLEEVYNNGSEEEKKWMDKNIFDALSRKMDEPHKKYVRGKKLT